MVEQPIACALDVSSRKSTRPFGIAFGDSLDDASVLLHDVIECQELVGENLPRA